MTAEQVAFVATTLAPFLLAVVGIVEAFKLAGMPVKFAAVVSILLGSVVGLVVGYYTPGVPMGLWVLGGVMMGAGATGGYALVTGIGRSRSDEHYEMLRRHG